jgi:hypothetical protein
MNMPNPGACPAHVGFLHDTVFNFRNGWYLTSFLLSYPQFVAGIHLFSVIPAVSGGYPF